ncbi:MAG: beta-ketoacyl-ACP synthase [Opitutales bacterium]|nr:beta-ketoacyl-ACP synthase [Opitutales bacterium]
MRRVVITGMSAISALGNDREAMWQRMHVFENCVKNNPDWEQYKGLRSRLSAPMTDYQMPAYDRKQMRTMSEVSVLGIDATEKALADAGIPQNSETLCGGKMGVAYGSCTGSLVEHYTLSTLYEQKSVSAFNSGTYVKMMGHTVPVNIGLFFKTTGRLLPTSTACTSGSLSIGLAYETIKYGLQDLMIAGGSESLSLPQVCIFDALFATSTKNDTPEKSIRPFDKDRDGLVIGEGAGTLILEELEHAKARGAHIYAEIVGFGTNTDGTHITNPNAKTMAIALQLALDSAGLDGNAIGYVNAHGTATGRGDIAETTATRNVFKRAVPISSLKSYIGHTLGACGALEAIASIDMMNKGWFAPTLNLENVDPACGELDYITGEGKKIDCEYVMSNNFAFGGINTSLIFKKWQ